MDLVYPAEYRDYRDHQFFLLSILVGMGTGNSADGGAGRIFDGTGGDGMQERDGTAFWEWR